MSSDKEFLGLLFQPFWWAGMAMAFVSVLVEAWSPLCFIGGILVGCAVTKCAILAAKKEQE